MNQLPPTALLELVDIHRSFKMENEIVHGLSGVNLRVMPGERLAITGPSGSGKSSLLNIIGLLDRPDTGKQYFEGNNLNDTDNRARASIRNQKIGFIFQNFNLLPNLSVLENICLPMHYANLPRDQIRELSQTALTSVGLSHRSLHRPEQLSGGERQRVAIARAIARSPRLLLADEPTGALDADNGHHILEIMERLNQKEGMTILMITHDNDLANRFPRCVCISAGNIKADTLSSFSSGNQTNNHASGLL